jgi:subtilisin family serine protease
MMADVRSDTVLIPTAVLDGSPGTVAALNEMLRTVDPELSIEEPTTKGPADGITRLRLSTGDAVRVVQALRTAKDVTAAAEVSPNPDYRSEPILMAAGSKIGHGVESLVPVSLHSPAPPWDAGFTGRRPVVALLDSGVDDTHPWLNMESFCVDAATRGAPVLSETGHGRYAGHGTFVTGLIRQFAPRARVLSLRIMNGEGRVDGGDFENALTWLLRELDSGVVDRRFDVLCIPFGYVPVLDVAEDAHATRVRQTLAAIAAHGVRIVASAGNRGEDVPTFPAAFAVASRVPMDSVGALNPDGRPAHYSNHGDWVTHREIGTALVSTMPEGIDGPESALSKEAGQELDPDNFTGGFGRWSGTSFATAIAAGRHAAALEP